MNVEERKELLTLQAVIWKIKELVDKYVAAHCPDKTDQK